MDKAKILLALALFCFAAGFPCAAQERKLEKIRVGGGSVGASLGTALGRGKGWGGKIFWFLLSMALPRLLERAQDLDVEDIGQHLRTTVERISSYFAKRKEERTHAEHDE